MSNAERIEHNNAELRECIEIAESLPDAPVSVGGYDIATMQKFVSARGSRSSGLSYLYAFYTNTRSGRSLTVEDLEWLTHIDLSEQRFADYMFYGCPFYGTPNMEIPLFDTSNIESMQHMFDLTLTHAGYGYYIKLPSFNLSKVEDLAYFCYCANLVEFPNIDFSKHKARLDNAFARANFKNTEIGNIAFITNNCQRMFENSNITRIGTVSLDGSTSSYITCDYMFSDCAELTEAPVIVTNKPLTMNYFLMRAKMITSLPEEYAELTLASGEFSYFASGCKNLVSMYVPNTANATRMDGTFDGATKLERIHNVIDFRNVSYATNTFRDCKALEYLMIKNLKANLQLGSGTSYGHLLTVDCLINACYELRNVGSTRTLTVGSANLAKLASVYVRLVEITDEMRAEDNLIGEKLPFERCESTDEGAMLISDYVLLKNWQLR